MYTHSKLLLRSINTNYTMQYNTARELRSNSQNLLDTLRTKLTITRISFAFSVSHIWNSLLSPELRACRTLSSFDVYSKPISILITHHEPFIVYLVIWFLDFWPN